jgi:hypothetical protein
MHNTCFKSLYLLLPLACAVLRYASHNTNKIFDKEKKQKKKESNCIGGGA